MKDISKLLRALNQYMVELHGKNDGNMDYENELKYWETEKCGCNAGNHLRTITGLDCVCFWLSDKNVAWKKDSRAACCCRNDEFYFGFGDRDDSLANLFLKLSDER